MRRDHPASGGADATGLQQKTKAARATRRPFSLRYRRPPRLIYRLGRPLRAATPPPLSAGQRILVNRPPPLKKIVAGLLSRRFDLGLISMARRGKTGLTIFAAVRRRVCWGLSSGPLRKFQAARSCACGRKSWPMRPFLFYPKRKQHAALSIDRFFHEIGDYAASHHGGGTIRRLSSASWNPVFGYSILPEFLVGAGTRPLPRTVPR